MRHLAVPLVAFALFAGCGDDEPDVDPEADKELIESAILELDDLPDGFEEVESDDDGDDDNQCNEDVLEIEEDEVDDARTARVGPVQFDSADDVSVVAEINAFVDGDIPGQIFEGITDDEFLDCTTEGIEEEISDQGTVDEVEEIDSPVDDGKAIAVIFNVAGPEGEVAVESQQHAVLVDERFGVTLQVTALEGEVDEGLVEDLLDAMVERLADED